MLMSDVGSEDGKDFDFSLFIADTTGEDGERDLILGPVSV